MKEYWLLYFNCILAYKHDEERVLVALIQLYILVYKHLAEERVPVA